MAAGPEGEVLAIRGRSREFLLSTLRELLPGVGFDESAGASYVTHCATSKTPSGEVFNRCGAGRGARRALPLRRLQRVRRSLRGGVGEGAGGDRRRGAGDRAPAPPRPVIECYYVNCPTLYVPVRGWRFRRWLNLRKLGGVAVG
jgi:hypothetical protein